MKPLPFKHNFRTEQGVDLAGALGYSQALMEVITHIHQVTVEGQIKRISALVLVNRIIDTNNELTVLLREAERELQAEKDGYSITIKKITNMENRILRYELQVTDIQIVSMPEDAQILTAQVKDGKLCLWAVVATKKALRNYKIHIYGTGHPFPSTGDRTYIATVQMDGLVWHIFHNHS